MIKLSKTDWILIATSIAIVVGAITFLELTKDRDTGEVDQGVETTTEEQSVEGEIENVETTVEEEQPVENEESELIPGGDESTESITL